MVPVSTRLVRGLCFIGLPPFRRRGALVAVVGGGALYEGVAAVGAGAVSGGVAIAGEVVAGYVT